MSISVETLNRITEWGWVDDEMVANLRKPSPFASIMTGELSTKGRVKLPRFWQVRALIVRLRDAWSVLSGRACADYDEF